MNRPSGTGRITRKAFLRTAGLGAAAVAGAAKASGLPDVIGPPDTMPNPDIVVHGANLAVYPTGDPEYDLSNLQKAVSYYPQYRIMLMARSRDGTRTGFLLPQDGRVHMTRDVELIGQGTAIEGGRVALYSAGGFSLAVKNLLFRGQTQAAVLGTFRDASIVSSGVDPLPPPSPASRYGFLLRVTGSLAVTNCAIQGARAGLFAEGTASGRVTSCSISGAACGAFLKSGSLFLSGNRISSSGAAGIVIDGPENNLSGNRFIGGSAPDIVIAPGASGTVVNIGMGSLASGVDPLPPPEPSIVDLGAESVLQGRYRALPPPPTLMAQLDGLYGEFSSQFFTGE